MYDRKMKKTKQKVSEYANLISFVPAGKEVIPNVEIQPTAYDTAISGEEAKAFYVSLISEASNDTNEIKDQRREHTLAYGKSSNGLTHGKSSHRKSKQAKTCKGQGEEKTNHHSEACASKQTPDSVTVDADVQVSSVNLHREEKRLLYFSHLGEIKSMKKLFKTNPNIDINYQDHFGWTALMCAVVSGHMNVVEYLLKKGADRSIENFKNQTASSLAEEVGFRAIQDKINNLSDQTMDSETTVKSDPFFCETCKSLFHESTLKEHKTSTLHLFNMNLKPNIDTFMIPKSNIGYKLMKQAGWDGEKGLGPDGKGQRLPVKTVLKRNRYCLGSKLEDKKERITHFGPYDTRATTSASHGSSRVMSAAAIGRRERRKREQRAREWERDLRQSMNF